MCAAAFLFSVSSIAFADQVPLFIFAGQSNMVGYATDSAQLTAQQLLAQPKILWAGRQELSINWTTMQAPTELSGQIASGHGFGPELSAPLTISNAMGGSADAAVKYALNGTGFGADIPPEWSAPSGDNYVNMVSRANTAISQLPLQMPGRTAQVSGFFWMQGERDAGDEDRADLYQYNLTRLINQVRTDFGDPSLPIVIGRIGADTGPHADVVRRAQDNIAKLLPNVRTVNTDDLPRATASIPNGTIHFSTQGTYSLGIRFGQAYLDIKNPPPSRPAPANKAVNGSFEDYAVKNYAPAPGFFIGKSFPADLITGWQAIGAGVTIARAGAFGAGTAPASDGSQWLSLENGAFGSGNGGASQSFSTVSGENYRVYFDYSALSSGDNRTSSFTYDVNGIGNSISVNTTGVANFMMVPWQRRQFSFTNIGTSATLRFLPTDPNDGSFYGAAIDNVKIIEGRFWLPTGGGTWTTAANWEGGVPNAAAKNANFLESITAAASINVPSGVTVGSIRFDNTNKYTLTGAGSITFSGPSASVLVLRGSHDINIPMTLGISTSADVASGSTLTFGGAVSGTSANYLAKFSAGTLVLGAASNPYQGITHVVEGTLRLSAANNNNITSTPRIITYPGATLDVTGLSSGSFSLAANQALNGSGSVRGGVNATAAGTSIGAGIVPANGVAGYGAMTFNGPGNITLNTNATVEVEIGGNNGSAGTPGLNFDQIVVDGTGKSFTTGGARLKIVPRFGIVTGQAYTLISVANGATINFSTVFKNLTQNLTEGPSFTEAGLTYSVDYDSTFVKITFTAVPEPGTVASLAAMCVGMILARRPTIRRPRAWNTFDGPA
ncbi:MAG TPA: sialate O-acetylesterase [Tepidisphaeraceae bacterium]